MAQIKKMLTGQKEITKMKQAIKILTIIIALAAFTPAMAQKGALKRANKLFANSLYGQSARLYEKVTKKDPNNQEALVKLGDSYRRIGNYAKAEEAYSKAAALGALSKEASFNYGTVLVANDKREEAKKYFAAYSPEMGTAFENYNKFYADSAVWKVGYANINTWQSDMTPAYYKKGIVFSSARKKGNLFYRTDASNESAFYNLYVVEDTNSVKKVTPEYKKSTNKKGKLKGYYKDNDDDTYPTSNDSRTVGYYYPNKFGKDSLKPTKEDFKLPKRIKGGSNKKFHDGPVVFYNGGDSVIFTRTALKKSKATKRHMLELYSGKFDGTSVTDVKPLPLNSKDYSVGHAALSPDNKTLYFVSDMPGGQGGTDLYMAKWENGAWGTPVNMGAKFNTPGNEMFPNVNPEGILFFSSNGWPGMGGLDVYAAYPEGSGFGTPENVGAPVNSEGDDFGFIANKDFTSGYFTSDRRRGGQDDDIYTFKHDNCIKLEITVLEKGTNKPIENARLYTTTLPKDQKDGNTNKDGKYTYGCFKKGEYNTKAVADGFDENSDKVDMKTARAGQTVKKTIYLSRYVFTLKGDVTTETTGAGVPNSTVYLRNLSTGEVRTVQTDASGNFDFGNLEPNSDYEYYAEKDGKKTNTISVSTKPEKASKDFKGRLIFPGGGLEIATIYYRFDCFGIDNFEQDGEQFVNTEELDKVIALMKSEPELKVTLVSYADARATSEYNDKLSANRSLSAFNYLVKKGIKKDRISYRSAGEANLTNACNDDATCNEGQHLRNRRTEVLRNTTGETTVGITKYEGGVGKGCGMTAFEVYERNKTRLEKEKGAPVTAPQNGGNATLIKGGKK